jgi:hypothetical protein
MKKTKFENIMRAPFKVLLNHQEINIETVMMLTLIMYYNLMMMSMLLFMMKM